MDQTSKEKLYSMPAEDLRQEVGIIHGIILPEGYDWHPSDPRNTSIFATDDSSRVLARELRPGVWISLIRDRSVGEHGPGWSWYICDKPGVSYWERGGGCLCLEAIKNAEDCARDSKYPPDQASP